MPAVSKLPECCWNRVGATRALPGVLGVVAEAPEPMRRHRAASVMRL